MLQRLYVHNFRCLENFTFDLTDRPSALLIGRNGSGKSTVRRALELLQRIGRGRDRVIGLISESDFASGRTDVPIRFEADVTLNGRRYTYSISFEFSPSFHEARIGDESLMVDGQSVFMRRHDQLGIGENAGSFGVDWHVIALAIVNDRPGEVAIQSIKEFFASMVLLSPIPQEMSGFSVRPEPYIAVDASDYASCLRSLLARKPAAYGEFERYVRSAIPDFSSIENRARGEAGTQMFVKFEKRDPPQSLSVEFDELSDGEMCFFLSAYVLAANAVGPPMFCFWDEPDNHMALSEVGAYATSLRKMANRGSQFVATSHHPETISRFSADSTFVLTRRSHLEPSVIRSLSEFSVAGDVVNALIRGEVVG